MAGIISPSPYLTVVDGNGLPISGALIWTYLGGTSTPQATFTDATLGVANTNPIVADSAGRFVAFLTPGANYKYVVETAATPPAHGSVIKTVDGISAPPDSPFSVAIGGTGVATLNAHGVLIGEGTSPIAATGSGTTGQVLTSNGASADPSFQTSPIDNGLNDFRLTLTTGVPVTTADVLAATTLYCTPSGKGNRIALFDSAGVAAIYTSAEFSIAVPATTSQMYDVFGYVSSGAPTLELLAWTNDTTRATALTLATTGVYTKTADLTRRYLGSFRTTTVSGQTEDSAVKRYLFNYYNGVPKPLQRYESTTTWTYTTATVRQANGAAANQVELVRGIADDVLDLSLNVTAVSSGTSVPVSVGIGEDSTTTYAVGATTAMNVTGGTLACRLVKVPAVGRHFYSWNEWSTASGTTTWNGAVASVGSAITNGLSGSIKC